MIKMILLKSLLGWNKYLTGSFKQKLIAYIIIGAICGFTDSSIKEFTGYYKQEQKEKELRKNQEEELIKNLADSVNEDLRKEADRKFEEIVKQNEEQFAKYK